MPSGMLNGRGSYDSMSRCEDDHSVFLSIRYHGTPFVIEKRLEMARAELAAKESLDSHLKNRFLDGAFPLAKMVVKILFLILFFPFHFCFSTLPKLFLHYVIAPVVRFSYKVLNKVIPPCVKVIKVICHPVAVFCRKIFQLIKAMVLYLQGLIKATVQFLIKVKRVIMDPPLRILGLVGGSMRKGYAKVVHSAKTFLAYCKVLVNFGFDEVKAQGKKLTPPKKGQE